MFKFPQNLYTDVRIEHVFETKIVYTLGRLEELKVRKTNGAFIRVFDGEMWYYSSISDIDSIQREIDRLKELAKPNEGIENNPIVKKFKASKDRCLNYEIDDASKISKDEKVNLLKGFFPIINSRDTIKMWNAVYVDNRTEKEFYSSKGADITFDTQRTGVAIGLGFAEGENNFSDSFQKGGSRFSELKNQEENLEAFIDKCENYLRNAKPVEKGQYTVVLSPIAAGVFAHESFGHKSEADFMVGDETMKKEWAIGKRVGSEILSIADSGLEEGSGFVLYDDEGNKAEKTYLIEKGLLKGRLHSASTAADLEEETTGNARAINFEYEPIVRMTTTYILPGEETKDELFDKVKDGIYIDTIKHGSGMSTFTMAPSLAYRIKDGKIAEPLKVSVISGSVFETLGEIDGLSNKLTLLSFIRGGCGKMEQFPLPVGFGGPYVRIKKMNVQ